LDSGNLACRLKVHGLGELESLSGGNRESTEPEVTGGFDHKLTGKWVIVTLPAISQGNPREVTSPCHREHDEFFADHAKPDPSGTPPATGVDTGATANAQPGLGAAEFLFEKLFLEFVHLTCGFP
jgi:hypothetical protein